MTIDKHTVTLHCFAFEYIGLHGDINGPKPYFGHNSIMYLQSIIVTRGMIALLFLGLPISLYLPASGLINNVANVLGLHSGSSNLSNHLPLSLYFPAFLTSDN